MTDHIHTLTVHLRHDVRDDDVKQLVEAIMQLKNVAKVSMGIVTGADILARIKAQAELRDKILGLLFEKPEPLG